MDALEFLKERKRMCNYYSHCEGCQLKEFNCALDPTDSDDDFERVIVIVEQWSKEHPSKTRQSVFLEQYPNVRLDTNGLIDISPCRMDPKKYPFNGKDCCKFWSCNECHRKFWMQEVE